MQNRKSKQQLYNYIYIAQCFWELFFNTVHVKHNTMKISYQISANIVKVSYFSLMQGAAEKFIGWPRYYVARWRLFFSIDPLAVRTLLSSLLQCLSPSGQKSNQQQIWHHHKNFLTRELFNSPSLYIISFVCIVVVGWNSPRLLKCPKHFCIKWIRSHSHGN